MNPDFKITAEMEQLLRNTVSANITVANQAKVELALALELPIKKGGVPGDNVGFIYSMPEFAPGITPEWPTDIISPGTEKNYFAYSVPNTGKIPQCQVDGDFVMVPTFDVATSLDWSRKFARDARWDIVARSFQVMEGNFTGKRNNDGHHTLISAGLGRGLIVYDSLASAGLFTKRVISLGKTVMRRNAGGNSTSVNQGRLTHLCMSPEGLEDIRSWDLTQVDDVTRREIFLNGEGEASLTKIFGVVLVDVDEYGVGQTYQDYYENVLGGTMSGSKVEIAMGLDLTRGKLDSFVMPWRKQPNGRLIELLPDPMLTRENREGYYARVEYGVGVLDVRRVLLLSF